MCGARMSALENKSSRPLNPAPRLLLGIAFLFPLTLLGAEQSVPEIQEPLPPEQPPSRFDSMEVSRDYLSGKITSFASYIDRFFGGDRHYQESNASVIQMNLTRTTGYGGDRRFDLAARLNLRLPVTEGRLRLLVETDPEKNITDAPSKGSPVLPGKVVVPKSIALAARYATAEEDAWHFHTDAGLKFPLPIKPFVRTAGNYSIPLGNWRLTAAESVYWFNTLGVGETTSLVLERILSEQLLFRSSSLSTWLHDKQNFDLRQDLTIYHTLDDRTALLYQASTFGLSNPGYQVTDSVLLVDYRYRLHQKWLFFEIIPQLHFPREYKYKSSFALSMRLEVLFDDSR